MNNNDIQNQLAKLRRNKKLLWLAIMFFVLVISWILLSIFVTTKTSSVSQELRNAAQSFVPRLESQVFEEILDKRAFSEAELSFFPIYVFDNNNVEKKPVMIDIMAPNQNLPNIVKEPAATEPSQIKIDQTQSEAVNPTATQATASANQDSGSPLIPIEVLDNAGN
jgi:hypothetical protein